MKKIIIPILLFLFVFGFSAQAATADLPDAGLTPDSPFYFVKTWKESIQTFFTFGAENKAKQYLHLAEVRLAEYQKMVDKGKTEIAQKTLDKYQKQLNNALQKAKELQDKGKDIKDLSQKIQDSVSKHLEVLQQNLQKVPDAAKKGIQNAIENSQKGLENILEKKNENASSTETATTEGWQTYRSQEYGFEFKYPAIWKKEEQLFNKDPLYYEIDLSSHPTAMEIENLSMKEEDYRQRIAITLNYNEDAEVISNRIEAIVASSSEYDSQRVQVGNYTGIRWTRKEGGKLHADNQIHLWLLKDKMLYTINLMLSLDAETGQTQKQKETIIFDQILSTFKFNE